MDTTDNSKITMRLIKDLAYKVTNSYKWISLEKSQNEFKRLMLLPSQSHTNTANAKHQET